MLTSGLCDSADVIQFSENIPDGYGGMKKVYQVIIRGYKCRKTLGTTEIYRYLNLLPLGMDRVNSWFVTGTYDKDVKEGMFLRFQNDRGELEDYEIVKIEEKKNKAGIYDHILMITEKV